MTNDSLPAPQPSSHPETEWNIDCSMLDIQITHEEVAGKTSFTRPWLIVIADNTGQILDMRLQVEPPDRTLLAAFMPPISNSENMPKVLWADNGKDFQGVNEYQISAIHISTHRSRGRGKIEHVFHSLNQGLPTFLLTQERGSTPPSLEELRVAIKAFIIQNNIWHRPPKAV